ncbi:uncharacterized protein [Typha latifolia]|uniref:uncharacterized protein n=1 Tax=Typha latifolia TaxID=4733 RepID=UPI003C2AE171
MLPFNARISSFLALYLLLLSSIISHAYSLSFKFDFSDSGTHSLPAMIDLQGDAFFNKFIRLTKEGAEKDMTWSIGRAVYRDPFPLWDKATGKVADFTTHFTFIIKGPNDTFSADGLAFFLSSYPSIIPDKATGGNLGLFISPYGTSGTNNQTVAVEFDTCQNQWDPEPDHVGIDVHSSVSVANVTLPTSISNGSTANVWISYNATTKTLDVFLTDEDNPIFSGNSILSHTLDLKELLMENVSVGFSAATATLAETHQILYWDFSSSISETNSSKMEESSTRSKAPLIIGLATAVGVSLSLVSFSIWFIVRRKKVKRETSEQEERKKKEYDESIDDEFEKGRGPRRFAYSELATATKNFADEGKLGEGGFGAVYRGFLEDLGLEVAIKRISKGSQQGRKEYIAEVKIISQLRHRNLVQLVGWCHDRGDFLLVYELMPNGSLDTHLYTTKGNLLTWSMRNNIALGLASALFYLHEEWESCVVHRDIKASNVMLDSSFNAKLGDFGLARLVDHGHGSQTTVIAGTMGYMAPEYVTTGKASKESDVYSFGIVALELACGRRPLLVNEDLSKIRLVEWVWDLYGRKAILEAADRRVLNGEFDAEKEMERLMIVGLWCAHPDCTARPSIRQVINALKLEVPLPTLPPKMPVHTMSYAPQADVKKIAYMTPTVRISSSVSGYSTNSSKSSMASGYPATISSSFWLLMVSARPKKAGPMDKSAFVQIHNGRTPKSKKVTNEIGKLDGSSSSLTIVFASFFESSQRYTYPIQDFLLFSKQRYLSLFHFFLFSMFFNPSNILLSQEETKLLYLCVSRHQSRSVHFPAMFPGKGRIISFLAVYFFLFSSTIVPTSSLNFKFNFTDSSTNSGPDLIKLDGDAFFNKFIRLTKDSLIGNIKYSTGRSIYRDPVPLWDKATGKVADFTTHFQFIINATGTSVPADGLSFFLTTYPSSTPEDSMGCNLGIFKGVKDGTKPGTNNQTVAVEFDTFQNYWDPSPNHVGIDVDSIVSVANVTWNTNMTNGSTANAWISYNATTKNLSVFLTYENNPIFSGNSSLSHTVDLRELLPENVTIGFSATTGSAAELHQIIYWEFSSSNISSPNLLQLSLPDSLRKRKENGRSKAQLIIGLIIAIGVLVSLVGFLILSVLRRKKASRGTPGQEEHDNQNYDESIDDEFEKEKGPRRFCYSELVAATKDFAEEDKLGEGGFGAVYRGFLKDLGLDVAIKRVSKGSKQGRKEYIAEVKIISQLRHRNLVQLVGWCHNRGDFLLVYELMPNGSLDSHLYTTTGKFLTWSLRYNIALDLASALLYLHEEWKSCVLHRDIKPSNVMLDSAFHAKLGDFGLARLVDHGHGSQTTVLAGTMGYVAPECVITGRASKESDVYSFGILALELACGRRPLEAHEDPRKVRMVESVWYLYGKKAILEAADARLKNGEREVEEEIERLMVVGLWCAHPDSTARPSIRQAISALKLEMPLPTLPPTMPVLMFFPPPLDVQEILSTSTAGFPSSASGHPTTSSCSTMASSDATISTVMTAVGY